MKAIWLALALAIVNGQPSTDVSVDIRSFGFRNTAIEVTVGTDKKMQDAVAGLVREHVTGLKAVADTQGKRDFAMAYNQLRTAAAHMQMIADPLASAIAKQFPEKYAMKSYQLSANS
ncbi:MAG TPA: hypothetical protein VH763_02645 [Gemmatimonadales bacterium]|jgi:hypothetical protein